ncbi:DExH-box ATP-dependent RNA helicase DExH3-like isoform X2 [Euphorbia lathyris]|uniref:DExH-box ATP-dependent RNA helicase DExH3-like isoform X2 n=1 Tax=Euphorbia lathyris TaxID=212925 RepID=UPI00331422A8
MSRYSTIFRGSTRTSTVTSLRAPFHFQFLKTPHKTLIQTSVVSFASSLTMTNHPKFVFRPVLFAPQYFKRKGTVSCSGSLDFWDWKTVALPYLSFQNSNYGRFAYQDASTDESDCELGAPTNRALTGSTLDNIDDWRWKLTMLLRKDEQEVVSMEKKDRRDFEHLSAMANRMGLHSRQYSRVVVFSKVPLPNYRPDLDDKRPQREVLLPFRLQREVEAHLNAYLSSKRSTDTRNFSANSLSRSGNKESVVMTNRVYEQPEPVVRNDVVMEKILHQKSLQLRNKQQAWQDSPEGQKMAEFRRNLPAFKERDALIKAISENQVVVVSGETGCGKTTQIPQYILESEIEAACGAACSIICTQPRRISAMAVSERVATERGENLGESVGYKVRLDGVKGRETRLLFCTTGILLRRLLVDRNLNGVTHVIVDEIHERGMNEDFLLIVLKELLPRRPELRLILMSATLNAELFSSYFGGAPVLHIPGFTYPVRVHFLEDTLEMTGYRLTTYNQIDDYGQEKVWKMQKQAQTLKKRKSQIASAVEDALEAANFKNYSWKTQESISSWNPDSIGFNLIEHVLCHIVKKERPGAVLVFMTGWDDINSLKDQLQAHHLLGDPSRVLLLACHGSMASSEQRLIFDKPQDGVRKVVLATNMAETSITIPDAVFVVDCGKAKETSYDAINNTPCLLPSWISKASARQRRGRAGRVQPGECYHLYPRYVYDAFSDYQLPELLRTPLQSLCLQIKSLQLGSILGFLSRALQPPEPLSLAESAKAYFSARNFSDHLALVRAYDGWRDAERKQSGYEYCWKNFLSAQTMKAIDSLRKQFFFLLKDTGLVNQKTEECSKWSYDEHLVRAVICAGLFPGICSVVNKEKSITLKTMEDGQVLLGSNSVNAGVPKIPYPWLVFNEKMKVNSVFLRDSTGISDSVLLLFGGNLSTGGLNGHLKMLGGYLEFFMEPTLADTYQSLKRQLEELIQKKLLDPKLDIQSHSELLMAIRLLVSEDKCEGKFVFGRQLPPSTKKATKVANSGNELSGNSKNELQTVLSRAGHEAPIYKTRQLKNNQFRATVIFNGLDFVGQPCSSKKLAEKDVATTALLWLKGEEHSFSGDFNGLSLLKKSKSKNQNRTTVNDGRSR